MALTKKLGAEKKKKDVKYFVIDPANADRTLEVLGKQFIFKSGEIEKIEVTKEEAEASKEKFTYLTIVTE